MENIKTTLLILIISILISSCKKEPATLITGTVVEFGTGTPVANARLSYIGGKSNGIFEPRTEWFIDTFRTNSQGKFEITPDDEAAEYYNITSVKKDNFYNIHEPLFFYPDDHENFEVELDPYAWLEIEAIDVDSIEGGSLSFSGTHVPAIVPITEIYNELFEVRGNKYIYIFIKSQPKDSIYISSLDTGFYQILY